tara:strand:- start:8968 stop:10041 length:1074 start_codon:yes stop_codon:yes gene_type:complete
MKILFALNHPAHYYLFKFIIKSLKNNNHDIKIVIKNKDVLKTLLDLEKVEYVKLLDREKRKKNIFSILSKLGLELVRQNISLFKYCKSFRPNIMIGTDISITHIGKIMKIPSIVYNEDDYEINKLFCKTAYPFASSIVAPEYTSVGNYSYKKKSYNGIQKMAYLNPKYFKPDENVKKEIGISNSDRYFIIRLVSLTSGHDIEGKHKGITRDLLNKIINSLKPLGKIYISSEDELPTDLISHKINIPKNKLHDLMAFSDIFIGDSQTMCAEAGILGVPFIRVNDFVGKIKYLDDLEKKYKLGWGVKPKDYEDIFPIIREVMSNQNIKSSWRDKKNKLFKDKTDLVQFSVDLIENYSIF